MKNTQLLTQTMDTVTRPDGTVITTTMVISLGRDFDKVNESVKNVPGKVQVIFSAIAPPKDMAVSVYSALEYDEEKKLVRGPKLTIGVDGTKYFDISTIVEVPSDPKDYRAYIDALGELASSNLRSDGWNKFDPVLLQKNLDKITAITKNPKVVGVVYLTPNRDERPFGSYKGELTLRHGLTPSEGQEFQDKLFAWHRLFQPMADMVTFCADISVLLGLILMAQGKVSFDEDTKVVTVDPDALMKMWVDFIKSAEKHADMKAMLMHLMADVPKYAYIIPHTDVYLNPGEVDDTLAIAGIMLCSEKYLFIPDEISLQKFITMTLSVMSS